MRVMVVDLGVGNLPNVVRALVRAGAQVQVTGEAAQAREASCLVLAGVGSAPAALRDLQERGLGPALQQAGAGCSGGPYAAGERAKGTGARRGACGPPAARAR